ncbi:NmrA family transcriptional regulator [Kineococcus xinjiangensis]|nr:NmrA family transcriptional regulator [Kineococcus xinjiangensis]
MTTLHVTDESTTTPPPAGTVLVTGATGKTGRRVAEGLRALGVAVRAASRAGAPSFDWNVPDSWNAALDGAGAAYVCYSPDLAVPGAPEVVAGFARHATEAGLSRLVLLSGRGEAEAQRAEAAVRAEFPAATVVRAAWFSQNFSESFFADAIREGTVATPSGDVPEPFVDVRDIADVAVAALTAPGHEGRVHEVTGPELLTLREAVGLVAAATGRDVRFVGLTPAEHRDGLAAAGVDPGMAALLDHLFTQVLDGRNASTTPDVERVLGRPARRFADYVREAAATGAWG